MGVRGHLVAFKDLFSSYIYIFCNSDSLCINQVCFVCQELNQPHAPI